MSPFAAIIISGIVATVVMTLIMYSVHWSTKMAHGDMIRTLGSFIRRSMDKSLMIGGIIHVIAGVGFAFLYYKLFAIMGMNTPLSRMAGGAVIGAAHGFIVSFILVIVVAEHHPIERFRKVGFPVALLYSVSHILYGFMLGVMLNAFALPPPSEPEAQTELGYRINRPLVSGAEVEFSV